MKRIITEIEFELPIIKERKPSNYPQNCEGCNTPLVKGQFRYNVPCGAYQNRLSYKYLCERCFKKAVNKLIEKDETN